jgi:hypothetical protein
VLACILLVLHLCSLCLLRVDLTMTSNQPTRSVLVLLFPTRLSLDHLLCMVYLGGLQVPCPCK